MKKAINSNFIKPIGSHINDGIIQISFTLPIPHSQKAKKAALDLCSKMGVFDPDIVFHESISNNFSYFIIYGKCIHTIELSKLSFNENLKTPLSKDEIEKIIEDRFMGEQIAIIGATTGNDNHTVGLDSILNIKGYNGDIGLEGYKGFNVINLGGQISNKHLLEKILQHKARVVLISQTVTEGNPHISNLVEIVNLLLESNYRKNVLLICGGPRLTNELAIELGFDHCFSKDTYPNDVANFICSKLLGNN